MACGIGDHGCIDSYCSSFARTDNICTVLEEKKNISTDFLFFIPYCDVHNTMNMKGRTTQEIAHAKLDIIDWFVKPDNIYFGETFHLLLYPLNIVRYVRP